MAIVIGAWDMACLTYQAARIPETRLVLGYIYVLPVKSSSTYQAINQPGRREPLFCLMEGMHSDTVFAFREKHKGRGMATVSEALESQAIGAARLSMFSPFIYYGVGY
jgi:hypothetical protein